MYLPKDTPASERGICEDLLQELQAAIQAHNPYLQDFLQLCQIPEEELDEAAFVISEKERPSKAGPRTYTSHNLSEVSVMMPETVGNRDIVVRRRGVEFKKSKTPKQLLF